jgi:hypothetical protein
MPTIRLTVVVELEHVSGKFTTYDKLCEAVRDAIDVSMPSDIDVDESNYNIASYDIDAAVEPMPKRDTRQPRAKAKTT